MKYESSASEGLLGTEKAEAGSRKPFLEENWCSRPNTESHTRSACTTELQAQQCQTLALLLWPLATTLHTTSQASLRIAHCCRHTGCHKHFHAHEGAAPLLCPVWEQEDLAPSDLCMAFLSYPTLPLPGFCLFFSSKAARHCFLNPNIKFQYVLFSFLAHGIFTMSSSELVSESTIQ